MKIKEAMKKAFVVDKDIWLVEAAGIMSSKKSSTLLFVLKKEVRGIITEGDLLKYFNKNKTISEIMSRKVITISSNEDIDRALEIMRENSIKRLPVVDKGELVGMLTLTDIAAYADELEEFFFD